MSGFDTGFRHTAVLFLEINQSFSLDPMSSFFFYEMFLSFNTIPPPKGGYYQRPSRRPRQYVARKLAGISLLRQWP